jgi:hypothetical protein
LEDLVERRLMLLYDQQFSAADLRILADELVAAKKLAPEQREAAIAAATARWQKHFGRTLR